MLTRRELLEQVLTTDELNLLNSQLTVAQERAADGGGDELVPLHDFCKEFEFDTYLSDEDIEEARAEREKWKEYEDAYKAAEAAGTLVTCVEEVDTERLYPMGGGSVCNTQHPPESPCPNAHFHLPTDPEGIREVIRSKQEAYDYCNKEGHPLRGSTLQEGRQRMIAILKGRLTA